MSQNNSTKPDFSTKDEQAQAGNDPGGLQAQIDALRLYIDQQIQGHNHSGASAQRIQLSTDVAGLFDTVSVVPSGSPLSVFDQIKIYVNGSTYRLYCYDAVGHTWHYATLT